MAVKTGSSHFDIWSDFLDWVIVLLRKTLSNALAPTLLDREFLFEIPNLCYI
jgi:hypothetical protein